MDLSPIEKKMISELSKDDETEPINYCLLVKLLDSDICMKHRSMFNLIFTKCFESSIGLELLNQEHLLHFVANCIRDNLRNETYEKVKEYIQWYDSNTEYEYFGKDAKFIDLVILLDKLVIFDVDKYDYEQSAKNGEELSRIFKNTSLRYRCQIVLFHLVFLPILNIPKHNSSYSRKLTLKSSICEDDLIQVRKNLIYQGENSSVCYSYSYCEDQDLLYYLVNEQYDVLKCSDSYVQPDMMDFLVCAINTLSQSKSKYQWSYHINWEPFWTELNILDSDVRLDFYINVLKTCLLGNNKMNIIEYFQRTYPNSKSLKDIIHKIERVERFMNLVIVDSATPTTPTSITNIEIEDIFNGIDIGGDELLNIFQGLVKHFTSLTPLTSSCKNNLTMIFLHLLNSRIMDFVDTLDDDCEKHVFIGEIVNICNLSFSDSNNQMRDTILKKVIDIFGIQSIFNYIDNSSTSLVFRDYIEANKIRDLEGYELNYEGIEYSLELNRKFLKEKLNDWKHNYLHFKYIQTLVRELQTSLVDGKVRISDCYFLSIMMDRDLVKYLKSCNLINNIQPRLSELERKIDKTRCMWNETRVNETETVITTQKKYTKMKLNELIAARNELVYLFFCVNFYS